MPGCVVRDQVHGHLGAHQLPGRQSRPLKAGTGLVDPDVDLFALLLAGVDDSEGGAEVDSSERTRVAVVQEVGAFGYDSRAVEAHAAVDLDILVRQRFGLGQERTGQSLYFYLRRACVLDELLGRTQESAGRPGQVDRGGTGRVERLLGLAQVTEEALGVAGRADVCGERHAVCGCGSDGGCAAHVHLTDAAGHLGNRTKLGDHLFAGQQSLVDHLHLPVLPVDGAHSIFLLQQETPPMQTRGAPRRTQFSSFEPQWARRNWHRQSKPRDVDRRSGAGKEAAGALCAQAVVSNARFASQQPSTGAPAGCRGIKGPFPPPTLDKRFPFLRCCEE